MKVMIICSSDNHHVHDGRVDIILVSEIGILMRLWRFENRENRRGKKKKRIDKALERTFLISRPLQILPWTCVVICTISPDLKQTALYLLLEEGMGDCSEKGAHSKSRRASKS